MYKIICFAIFISISILTSGCSPLELIKDNGHILPSTNRYDRIHVIKNIVDDNDNITRELHVRRWNPSQNTWVWENVPDVFLSSFTDGNISLSALRCNSSINQCRLFSNFYQEFKTQSVTHM